MSDTHNGGGWIGVDLDGVLAIYPHSFPEIGPPIPVMVDQVRAWIAEGRDVRIFTARVAVQPHLRSEHDVADEQFAADQQAKIHEWCARHLGHVLPVTAVKDFKMIALYDDRCVQMLTNRGLSIAGAIQAVLDWPNE